MSYAKDIKITCSKRLYSVEYCKYRCSRVIETGTAAKVYDKPHSQYAISSFVGVYTSLDFSGCYPSGMNYSIRTDSCAQTQRAYEKCLDDCEGYPIPCDEYKIDVEQMIKALPTSAVSKFYDPNLIYQ